METYPENLVDEVEDEEEENGESAEAAIPGWVSTKCSGYPRDSADRKKKIGPKVEVAFDFQTGKNLEEAVALFGSEFVFERYLADSKVRAQGYARAHIENGMGKEQVEEIMSTYTLTDDRSGPKDPKLRAQRELAVLSVEDRRALLQEILTPEELQALQA